ncbi:SH3 domain-containing protein [Virgibacillus pantothenticus]|uniref:SH3 domain-containing protein n=1 Tax=Virgibacillus pantothenticus TaxID=1473 RepID=UPI0025B0911D|nr:SH3 domain-containing protein [Virgibacillus pantothenticus]
MAVKKNSQGLYFAPLDRTTRGEMSAMLNRMLKLIDEPKINVSHTNYNYSFKDMIDIQVTKTPKVDGAGKYIASRSLVEYYANPNNFSKESSDYLQFLKLSENASLNSNEINRKVLHNKGNLSGQANSFIQAGNKYGVNEVYLMAHALHETGNGTSKLATGVPVDKYGDIVHKNKASHIVYNMYGYGAVDNNPLQGGAKYAFNRRWFTPAAAIIGGARDIANNYINSGQDTLYKMRWNPNSPGYPQYATHVQWAVLQTKRIHEIYSLLDYYILKFDVPTFKQQPNASPLPTGDKAYHVDPKYKGKTAKTTASVNLRTGPTTSFNIIRTLGKNITVTIIGDNGGWYKIKVNEIIGWISGNYLQKENARIRVSDKFTAPPSDDQYIPNKSDDMQDLLAITTSDGVRLRKEPSTENSDNIIKQLASDIYVYILDENPNWYFVSDKQDKGWISKDYVAFHNLFQVTSMESNLNVRTEPNLDGEIIGKLQAHNYIRAAINNSGELIIKGNWIKIYFKNGYGWINLAYIQKQDSLIE